MGRSDMDARNGGARRLLGWRLAAAVGLRQILDPGTAKVRGYNPYHLAVIFGLLLPTTAIVTLSLVGLYWRSNDRLAVILYPAYAFHFIFCSVKMVHIMRHSGALWECYE